MCHCAYQSSVRFYQTAFELHCVCCAARPCNRLQTGYRLLATAAGTGAARKPRRVRTCGAARCGRTCSGAENACLLLL